jgi:3-dehydroquinate dehydratase type I
VKIQICAPIAAENASEAMRLIRKAEARGADLIELRLDYFNDLKGINQIVESTSLPIIATNRQYEQGGHRPQNEDQRVQALLDIAGQGFRYVDVELTTAGLNSMIHELKKTGAELIISFHDFKQTPSMAELEKIVESQMKVGADICKLVTTANSIDDSLSCLLLTSKMSRKAKVLCLAMGKMGILSRVLCPLFGAQFTYASVEKGRETASGQLSISDLKKLYRKLGVKN